MVDHPSATSRPRQNPRNKLDPVTRRSTTPVGALHVFG
jgi:hypothetical protein